VAGVTAKRQRSRTFTTPYGRKVKTSANKRFILVFESWMGVNTDMGEAKVVMRSDNYQTIYNRRRIARRSIPTSFGRSFAFYIFDKFTGERMS
jgi:hypothetical protein